VKVWLKESGLKLGSANSQVKTNYENNNSTHNTVLDCGHRDAHHVTQVSLGVVLGGPAGGQRGHARSNLWTNIQREP